MSSPILEIGRRHCTVPSTGRCRPRSSRPPCGDRAHENLRPPATFHHLHCTNSALPSALPPLYQQISRLFRGRNDLNHRQYAIPLQLLALAQTVETKQDTPFVRLFSLGCTVFSHGAARISPLQRCNMPRLSKRRHFFHIGNTFSPTNP